MQVRAYDSQQQSRDKEVMSLRQQLVDFQAQSDEKTVIGQFSAMVVVSSASPVYVMEQGLDLSSSLFQANCIAT